MIGHTTHGHSSIFTNMAYHDYTVKINDPDGVVVCNIKAKNHADARQKAIDYCTSNNYSAKFKITKSK